jgi:hypothetical protein
MPIARPLFSSSSGAIGVGMVPTPQIGRVKSMIPKSGRRFPACAKPLSTIRRSFDASAGEDRSEKIMLKQQAKAKYRINRKSLRFSAGQAL